MPRATKGSKYGKGELVLGPRCGLYIASKSGTLRTFDYTSQGAAVRADVVAELERSGYVLDDGCRPGGLGIYIEQPLNDYAKHTKAVYKCLESKGLAKKADKMTFGQKARVVSHAWKSKSAAPLCSGRVPAALNAVAKKDRLK